MRLIREQMRAQLLAEAEGAIDEYLDWREGKQAASLSEIEEAVLAIRQRLGTDMAEVVLEGEEARQPVEPPLCPGCGEPMRYKGQKESYVESRLGTLSVERGYYHCGRCESGLFPPGGAATPAGGALE